MNLDEKKQKDIETKEKVSVSDAIKETLAGIETFFSGEGNTQLSDSKNAIAGSLGNLKKVKNFNISNNSVLLSTKRYFKAPSLKGLNEEEFKYIFDCNNKAENVLNDLNRVVTLRELVSVYNNLQKLVLPTAEKITKDIFSLISEIKSMLTAAEMDKVAAKTAARKLKHLAKIRNSYLAPCFVIKNSLKNIEKMKTRNT